MRVGILRELSTPRQREARGQARARWRGFPKSRPGRFYRQTASTYLWRIGSFLDLRGEDEVVYRLSFSLSLTLESMSMRAHLATLAALSSPSDFTASSTATNMWQAPHTAGQSAR